MLGLSNIKIIKVEPTLGKKWVKSNSASNVYKCIDVMNDRMVAISFSSSPTGGAYYSDDGGITFKHQTSGITRVEDICYNDGLLFYVSSYQRGLYKSTDGASFVAIEGTNSWDFMSIYGAGQQWILIDSSNGAFIATTSEISDTPPDNSYVSTFNSSVNFMKALDSTPVWVYNVARYGTRFTTPSLYRDSNFEVAVSGSITNGTNCYDAVKFNNLYVVGTSKGLHYTANEPNFSTYDNLLFTQSNISTGTIYNIHASDKTCIAVGTDIWRSTVGKAWTALGISGATFKKVCSDGNGTWVAGGNSGALYYSNDDGVTFNQVEGLTTAHINWIHYNNKFKTFVICANDGIYYSK